MSREQVTYLETGSTDPYYNLAFEDYVLAHRRDGDYLILWQNDNTIVIGRNQNAEAEINRRVVEERGIRVVRRQTGGGAVYHDLGNLNYSFITDSGELETLSFSRFTAPVVRALRALGADAEASGRNDILISGRKVSGTAQRVLKNRVLHHGTLLYDSDPQAVADALNVDPEKFRDKASKSVRSRIGNIRDYIRDPQMTLPEFWEYLKTALAESQVVPGDLTEEEKELVRKLRDEKYATWDWNFGTSPRFTMRRKRRFAGGSLEVLARVEKGRIKDVIFYGDFLATEPLEPVTEALRDCAFTKDAVGAILAGFRLQTAFGGITKEEILQTIFEDPQTGEN